MADTDRTLKKKKSTIKIQSCPLFLCGSRTSSFGFIKKRGILRVHHQLSHEGVWGVYADRWGKALLETRASIIS